MKLLIIFSKCWRKFNKIDLALKCSEKTFSYMCVNWIIDPMKCLFNFMVFNFLCYHFLHHFRSLIPVSFIALAKYQHFLLLLLYYYSIKVNIFIVFIHSFEFIYKIFISLTLSLTHIHSINFNYCCGNIVCQCVQISKTNMFMLSL
jgi:hypothetical protein